MDRTPALLQEHPELAERLPWVGLTSCPTRVHRLSGLGKALGAGEIWIKRDDESCPWYGGNKPRKLEFLLGEARARGHDALLTFGALGSNHALATAICGAKTGFSTELVLVPQPVTAHVRRNLLAAHRAGARLRFAPSKLHAVAIAARAEAAARLAVRRPPYRIPPGGSSPLGTLGYVSAALELKRQVLAGELPEPDVVFVPLGSNGTMAGLIAGMRLAAMDTRVVGVRVSDMLRLSSATVARLASRTLRLLGRLSPELAADAVSPRDVTVLDGYLGAGYGQPTVEGRRAVDLMREHEAIELEGTYTGKTLAAMIDHVATRPSGAPVLFWNTFSSVELPSSPVGPQEHLSLPTAFHRFFEPIQDHATEERA